VVYNVGVVGDSGILREKYAERVSEPTTTLHTERGVSEN
jgi:hypothetical protein